MGGVKEIQLHRRAEMALDAFPAAEREKIERALAKLANPSEDQSIRAEVWKLSISDPDYILRATPDARVLFNETPRAIQVLDIVLADKLKSYSAAGRLIPSSKGLSGRGVFRPPGNGRGASGEPEGVGL